MPGAEDPEPESKSGAGQSALERALRHAKRVIVMIVGGSVLLVGLALIVLPGPAVLVIPAGLAILALEFAWARRWLQRVRDMFPKSLRERERNPDGDSASGDS